MEDSRPLDNHGVQLSPQTLLRNVLQGPVPVVVIVGAEVAGALPDVRPSGAIEGEAHVVLTADPGHDLHLPKRRTRSTKHNAQNNGASNNIENGLAKGKVGVEWRHANFKFPRRSDSALHGHLLRLRPGLTTKRIQSA